MKQIIDTTGNVVDGNIGNRLLIAILAAVAILASCAPKYTPNKAIASVDKANSHFPAPVAEWTRKHYPCITKASDTVVLSRDSVVYIDCPDLPQIVHEAGATDTVYSTKTIRVPVHLPIEIRYITQKIKDSADVFLAMQETERVINDRDKQVKKVDQLGEKVGIMTGKRDYWRTRFFILAGIFGLAIFLRIKRIL